MSRDGHRQRAMMASDSEWDRIGREARRRGMDRSRYLVHRALAPDAVSAEALRHAVREMLVLSRLEERRLREAGAGAGAAWEDACDAVDGWLARVGTVERLTDPGAANRWKAPDAEDGG